MGIKVAKFGGTSLANAAQFAKVIDIVRSDEDRRYVVPSAPGKRHSDDDKVTDLLLHCHRVQGNEDELKSVFGYICSRFQEIIDGLGLTLDLSDTFEEIYRRIASGASVDYCASRGEYLSGRILAHALGYEFVDPAEHIFFTMRGAFDSDATHLSLAKRLRRCPRAVIPGFYGAYQDGRIKTFSRGGSDVTGSIVARAVQAEEYENWTDVSGFMMADPRIVADAQTIRRMSYRELRELSYMGANVLHEDSIFPVRQAGIPIHIRNTNRPQDAGTLIENKTPEGKHSVITGVAGRKGFTFIMVEKAMMNSELGFGRRVLSVLENHGISFEYMPTGIDTLSVVVSSASMEGKRDAVMEDIAESVDPDHLELVENMAIIATVGHGMVNTPGTAAKIFVGLAQANVNIRMIDQGSSELNVIVGVEAGDYERAIDAIYHAFMPRKG